FTVTVPNLPFGSGKLDQHQRSKAHLPTSAPLRPSQGAGIRPVIPGGRRRCQPRCRGFPAAFRLPAFASWASCSCRGVPLSSRSAYQDVAWTPAGFPRSTHPSHGRIGCPLYPEAKRCCHGRSDPSGRRSPPLPGARPYHPGVPSISRDCLLRGVIKGPLAFTRPAFPLACNPRMERGLLGLAPRASHPQARPAAHAEAGDGHRALARSYTTGITGPPIHELTRNVRPRVARPAPTCPASPPPATWCPGPSSRPRPASPPAGPKPPPPASAAPGSAAPSAKPPYPPPGPAPSQPPPTSGSSGAAAKTAPWSPSATPPSPSPGTCCPTPAPASPTSVPTGTTASHPRGANASSSPS